MLDKNDLWDIQVHIKKHHHKDIGGSNICITDETIMVAQYAKRRYIKSKGVMATNEQGGSMLNNRSLPQEYKVVLMYM